MKRFLVLGAIVALVVAIWSGAWLFLAGFVRGEIVALAEADGISAPKVECADLGVGGYPFRFDVTCTDASILSGDLLFTINEVRASVRVYRPTHMLAFAQSPARMTDAFSGSQRELRWSDLEASVRLDGWRLARASLVAENPVLLDTLIGEDEIARASGLQLHLLDIPERYDEQASTQSLALYQELTGLDMPANSIADGLLQTEAEINALPADVRLWAGPGLLRRWQAAGGTLDLFSLDASDAERSLTADGEFSLNEEGRLSGRLNLTSNGLAEEFGGMLPEAYREILFAEPAEDGSFSNSIRFTNGLATAGLLPLGFVPPLF